MKRNDKLKIHAKLMKKFQLSLITTQKNSFESGRMIAIGFKDTNSDIIYVKTFVSPLPRVHERRLLNILSQESREIYKDNIDLVEAGFVVAAKSVTELSLLQDATLVPTSLDSRIVFAMIALQNKGMSGRRLINELYGYDNSFKTSDLPTSVLMEVEKSVKRLERKGLIVKTKLGTFWYPPYFYKNMTDQGIDPKEMVIEV